MRQWPVGSLAQSSAKADQPRMESALDDLKEAKRNLENASEDKGGFRMRALNNVKQAIEQVEKGIVWDKTHQGRKERRRD